MARGIGVSALTVVRHSARYPRTASQDYFCINEKSLFASKHDFRSWHFCDMAKHANEVRSKPGSGHPCASPRKARVWVHGQISQTVLFLFARALPTAG